MAIKERDAENKLEESTANAHEREHVGLRSCEWLNDFRVALWCERLGDEGERERKNEGKGIEFRNEQFRRVVLAISERRPTKTK